MCVCGKAVAEAVLYARELANDRADYVTPALMEEQASRVAREHGLKVC